VSLLGSFV